MKMKKKKVSKPISLAGCLQIFAKAGIPETTYSNWGIGKIFDEAERMAMSENIICEELFIDIL